MILATKMLHLLIFIHLLASSFGDEFYQNSSNICSKCLCNDAQTFTIDCSNQNFVYMLAEWPSEKSIKAIFTGNNFTQLEKIPTTQSTLEIVLSRCNIQSLDPAVFEGATRTRLVDLSHNFLTREELHPDRFRGPFKDGTPEAIGIEHLDLSYNQIHSLHKDVFEFLPNLKWLSLEGNDFRVLDTHTQLALSSVPEILTLNLGNNELTELIPGAISQMQKLRELDLSRNDLDFVPETLRVVGQSLEVLVVDENPIFELTGETFSGLHNLKEISANNLTKLEHIDDNTFYATPNLTTLHLCNNKILYNFSSNAFHPNSTLKQLFLSNTNLTTLPYSLVDWSKLDALNLKNNPFVCTCDLYKISSALSSEVKRDGPTCVDSSAKVLQVYSLTSDICEAKVARVIGQIRYQHISVPLAGLIVSLIVGIMAATTLGYHRYRSFLNSRDDFYASQVMYSPLLNARA